MQKTESRSLRYKMFIAIISVVVIMLISISAMFFYNMDKIAKMLLASNREMSRTSNEMSSSSMDELSQVRLQELADNKADIANNVFTGYEQAVRILASSAERLYSDPERYSAIELPLPVAENDGQLSIQTLFAPGIDPDDDEIAQELGLLGNLQDALYVLNDKNESIASIYVATESGIVAMSDFISGKKFGKDGRILPLDARERPWYQGAKEAGVPYFTPVTTDSHTPRRGIMCGVPIYREGVLMGVAGAGMYLDDIDTLVQGVELGENGDACIINQYGQVLFSTFEDGVLAVSEGGEDVRSSAGEELAKLVNKAVASERGVELVEMDGIEEYVAYSPMEAVGWSLFIVLSREEVDKPTVQLQDGLSRISAQAISDARSFILRYNLT